MPKRSRRNSIYDNGQHPNLIVKHFLSKKVEAAGIEPSSDFDATENSICDCENCQQCRAANALHFDCFKSHFLASFDADLQCVIDGWEQLDAITRHTIAAQFK